MLRTTLAGSLVILVVAAAGACSRPEIRGDTIGASDDMRSDLAQAVREHAGTVMAENLSCTLPPMTSMAEPELEDTGALAVIDLGELDDVVVPKGSLPATSEEAPSIDTAAGKAKTDVRSASEAAERTNKRPFEGPTPASPISTSSREWMPAPLSPTVPVETAPGR